MYKVIFENGIEFISKSNPLINSKWNKIPKIPIKKIEYNYLGIKLILIGYEKYNHLIKHKNALFTNYKQIPYLKILAKKDNEIKIFIWDLIKNKFKIETKKIEDIKPSTGWKIGSNYNNPIYKINP